MTTRRDIPRMQVTGLSKLMAGDHSCLFRPWYKSWHQGYRRLSGGGEGLAAWQARHSLAVHELADRLEREGCEVFIEDQNWFDTMSASGSVLSGKPDIIAHHPDGSATVYDVRVRSSDITGEFIEQVAAYMARIVAPEPGRAVPSRRECQWCELSRDYCPERIEDPSRSAAD